MSTHLIGVSLAIEDSVDTFVWGFSLADNQARDHWRCGCCFTCLS